MFYGQPGGPVLQPTVSSVQLGGPGVQSAVSTTQVQSTTGRVFQPTAFYGDPAVSTGQVRVIILLLLATVLFFNVSCIFPGSASWLWQTPCAGTDPRNHCQGATSSDSRSK
jgi:hypothetical protein